MKYVVCYKIFLFICLTFIGITIPGNVFAQKSLRVEFKIQSRTSLNLNDIRIILKSKNSVEKTENYSVDTLPTVYELDYNDIYLVSFDHPDYYDKSIEINTYLSRKYAGEKYSLEIEVTMDNNCEQNPDVHRVIYKPIGRIEFNRSKKKFDYDAAYTFRMGERYDKRRKERCELVAEAERFRKKLQKLEAAGVNDPGKRMELKRQEEQLAALEKLQAQVITKQKEESLEEIKLEQKKETDKIASNENKNKIEKDKAVVREPLFDEKQQQIHIFPKAGWPSEVANSILDDKYKPRPIGTFTYDLSKGRTDFYVPDAEELRKKFPEAFEKAFPNWDYIVETNTKYKNKNK